VVTILCTRHLDAIGAQLLSVFLSTSSPTFHAIDARRHCLRSLTRRGDSRVTIKAPSTPSLKLILDAETRVSINRELSLSWMFRAKRLLPVGGDVAPRSARNLATPSFTSEGSSSIAPASQHRKQTSASARDKGDDDTSPSSSQAARNRFTASSDAWLCPAHLYSPEAFARTVLFLTSSAARDARAVPSPSSSKLAARRDARVVRARLRG